MIVYLLVLKWRWRRVSVLLTLLVVENNSKRSLLKVQVQTLRDGQWNQPVAVQVTAGHI